MHKQLATVFAALVLALACSPSAHAQEPATPAQSQRQENRGPEHFYKLDFRVLEFSPENKLIDTRGYSAMTATGVRPGRITSMRTNDHVLLQAGTTYSSFDIGVNVDVSNPEELDRALSLIVAATIRSVSVLAPATPEHPLNRDVRWDSQVTIPIGKPTVIFSSDNAADHGKTELEVTATLIK